jgi:hypothetical protein
MSAQDRKANALMLARTIGLASDQEVPDLFLRLRKSRRLSAAVHSLNQLLMDRSRLPPSLTLVRSRSAGTRHPVARLPRPSAS